MVYSFSTLERFCRAIVPALSGLFYNTVSFTRTEQKCEAAAATTITTTEEEEDYPPPPPPAAAQQRHFPSFITVLLTISHEKQPARRQRPQ